MFEQTQSKITRNNHVFDYDNRHTDISQYSNGQTGNKNSNACYTDFSGTHTIRNYPFFFWLVIFVLFVS